MSKSHLTCCICGDYAGRWEQHHNRDDGYGICGNCAPEEAARLPDDQMRSLYGVRGVNYPRLFVKHYGRWYDTLAKFRETNPDVGNGFMERRPDSSLLCILDGYGFIVATADTGLEVAP